MTRTSPFLIACFASFALCACPGAPPPECGPSNCSGCCDASGTCISSPGSPTAAACGGRGGLCEVCAKGQVCDATALRCVMPAPEACGPSNCADGCCVGNTCRRGVDSQSATACGRGGQACLDCTAAKPAQFCDTSTGSCRWRRVFLTSNRFRGDFGYLGNGLSAADSNCSTAAQAAQLPGSFKAWLSSGSTRAVDRLADKGPWIEQCGDEFYVAFLNKAGLSTSPLSGIDCTEQGDTVSEYESVWTGTLSSGEAADSCSNWSKMSGFGVKGKVGAKNSLWTQDGYDNCTSENHLICLEQ